jgi:hypothetical protein
MNPTVHLDFRYFFSCKSYGHLMGWSTPVDFDYDVVDLDYNIIDKNKKICEGRSKQILRRIF